MRADWTSTRVLGTAVILLLGAGTLHHWAHRSRASAASTYRPPAVALSSIPTRFGSHTLVRDLSLDEETLRVAGVDCYLHRSYAASPSDPPVSLYVGYWGYQNTGMGHGPEVCFPSVGWEAEEAATHHDLHLRGADGKSVNATYAVHHFTRMEPEGTVRVAVGFTAAFDRRFRASSRGFFLHRPADLQDAGFLAHVIVSTNVRANRWQAADARVAAFLEQVLPHVSLCLFGGDKYPGEHNIEEDRGGV